LKGYPRHARRWRDPAQIAAEWEHAGTVEPALLRHQTIGKFWETLAEERITLLVTRETEHLILALRADATGAHVSYITLPHPSGVAVDRNNDMVHVASTRNPNKVFDFEPCGLDASAPGVEDGIEGPVLLPLRSRSFPGSLYLHDLALVGATLHGNAVGENAVVEFDTTAGYRRVWWPRSIEASGEPLFNRNHLQLNSIAASDTLAGSYFSASAATVSSRRPGHLNFLVDGRGVIFSGRSREPVVGGLTRPHSARLHEGRVWVDNSGYGTFGPCEDGRMTVAAALPGWTRGLCFAGHIAFVGTSRIIPGFERYAPGLVPQASVCGVHAVNVTTGEVLGSIVWPAGNQIFAVDWLASSVCRGFPFRPAGRARARERRLFYAFKRPRDRAGAAENPEARRR
jgi:uncharacterized protein (TIGR03032 family)